MAIAALEERRLARDPGRPPLPLLVGRVLASELRNGARSLSLLLGFRCLQDALSTDWAIPDSNFAQRAIELASRQCPEFILRHSFRSYAFGAILAGRNELRIDREAFFVAALLHDLGLCGAHASDPASFEYVGASLAHSFCRDEGESDARAALVHDAIALHTSVGIADRRQAEIALLHLGTGMDLFGMRIDEVPRELLEEVLAAYPRRDFKAQFSPCLERQAREKPASHIAGAVRLGIVGRIRGELLH